MIEFRRAQTIWNSILVFTGLVGFFILVVFLIPQPLIKTWLDSLTPDGSLESFTPGLFTALKRVFIPLGLVSLLAAAGLLRARNRADQILASVLTSTQRFIAARVAEIRHLKGALQGLIEDSRYAVALLVIIAIGILHRAMHLLKPVSHDEAYTFMAFASRGVWQVLTDYHLPNNHVFHSLLVLISSNLLGIEPWAIRMPAFIAGILIIPATYFVARVFYDRQTALVSAAWVASIPALIGYATNARGYSLISLFTLILIGLGVYVKEHKSWIGWSAFIVVAALGFYTLPIMLYPFGLVMTWLALSALFNPLGKEYGEKPFLEFFIKFLIPAGLAVLILVVLLYSPIFWFSGIESVVGNSFVAPMGWSEFLESIEARLYNTWEEWNKDVPPIGTAILVIGIGASIIVAFVRKPARIHLAVPAVLWIGSVLLIQRVAPWPRVWIFLLPLVIITAAGGLLAAARFLSSKAPAGEVIYSLIFAGSLLIPLSTSLYGSLIDYRNSQGEVGNIEELAIFMRDFIDPKDVIIVTSPDTVTLRYYLKQLGVDGQQTDYHKDQEYQQALVVVNQRYGQTLESVLESRTVTSEIDASSPRTVYHKGKILVYAIDLTNNGD